MSSNCSIGADDAKAPIAIWGYFSLNHAANTEKRAYGHMSDKLNYKILDSFSW